MEESAVTEINTKPDGENISVKEAISVKADDGLKGVLEEFAEKTTISAFALIHHRSSIFWRIIWLLVVLFILSISIYQAVELIKNYLRYPSFITQIEKLNSSLYMPSITLCNQNTVNWEKVKKLNHSMLYAIERKAKQLKETGNAWEMRIKLQELLMNEVHAMNTPERKNILTNIDDWLVSYIGIDAQGLTFGYQYNNKVLHAYSYFPQFGNCITINPGLTESTKVRFGKKSGLLIAAEMKPEMQFPYLGTISALILSIHSPGSAPVIGWNKELAILPGEFLQIDIQVTDIKRLPIPYASMCINEEEEISNLVYKYSPYRSKGTAYLYSREECLATCSWYLLLEEKQCYLPDIALYENHELGNKFNLCSNADEYFSLTDIEEECYECRKRCRELLFDWTPKSSIITEHSPFLMDFLNVFNKTVTNTTNAILIGIEMKTNSYIYAEETAKYELEDIFGSIGGNFGLWIGLSIMSACEIFELLTNIVAFLIRKVVKSKRS